MSRGDYIEHLRCILSYDSMIDLLEVSDRYWLHREIINNYGDVTGDAIVSITPFGNVLNVSNKLRQIDWKRPELRYNSYRELEEYSDYFWKPFNLLNHV